MKGKGSDALLENSRVTEWTFRHGGYLTFVFGGFLIAGCISAYVIAVARGNVDPFLPLISDAAGTPPQNGLFGVFITLGGMTGVIFMILRLMVVLEKNQEKSQLVTRLNKASLVVGISSMLGITLVTGFPINFYRNKDIWFNDVGLPHMIGGAMLFGFGLVYMAIQCTLTFLLSSKDRNILAIRSAICTVCAALFVYHLITIPGNFGGISHLYFDNNTYILTPEDTTLIPYPKTMGSSLKLPIDTSGNYLSTAISQWLLVFFFCGFFFTFFRETQEYSLLVVVETEMPLSESLNDVSSDQSGVDKQPSKLQVSSESRDTEVRTYFRRDSTSQTVTEDPEESAAPTKATFTSFENGRYTKRQVSSFEVPTENNLEKPVENDVRKCKSDEGDLADTAETNNSMVNGISESTDLEASNENVTESEATEGDTENAVFNDIEKPSVELQKSVNGFDNGIPQTT